MFYLIRLIVCAFILLNSALNAAFKLSFEQVAEENIDSLRYIEEEYPDEEYYSFLQCILGYQLQPNARKNGYFIDYLCF